MNHYQTMGIIAGIIASLAFVPYIRSILKKDTRPHRTTWFVLALTGWLTLLTYQEVGAVESLIIAIAYAFFSTLIFTLSLWFGRGGWQKFDLLCLSISILGITVWLYHDSAFLGLVCFLVADFFALLPTLRKTWEKPWQEDTFAWFLSSIGALMNIFAIEQMTIEMVTYPLYMLVINTCVFLLTLTKGIVPSAKKER